MRRTAIGAAHAIALICVPLFLVGSAGAQTPPGRVFFRGDRGQSLEIYSMYANGTHLKNLTNFNWAEDEWPDVSPDGTRVVFSSTRDNASELYVMNADGSDQRRLTENASIEWNPKWSPDDSQILYFAFRVGRHGLWILDVNTGEERFVTEGVHEFIASTAFDRARHTVDTNRYVSCRPKTTLASMNSCRWRAVVIST